MNVKQGDLAIVIDDRENPSNNGFICMVGEFVGRVEYEDGSVLVDAWDCRSCGSPFDFGDVAEMEGYFEDRELRPIFGIPDSDAADEHLTKPVTQPEKEIA